MRAYEFHRFEEWPDVGDIQEDCRKSCIGKLPEKCGVFKPYIRRAKNRKQARRIMKRRDKARMDRRDFGHDRYTQDAA